MKQRSLPRKLAWIWALVVVAVACWWLSGRPRSDSVWREAWTRPAETVPATVPGRTPAGGGVAPRDSLGAAGAEVPNDEALAGFREFPHALVPVDDATSSAESVRRQNASLKTFLEGLAGLERESAWRSLRSYLEGEVPARWKSALELELARGWFERGEFAESREIAGRVWERLRRHREPGAASVADQAMGQLLRLELGRGDARSLRRLVSENEGRPYHGALEGLVARARQAVWLLEHTGAENIVCGPRALNAILDYRGQAFEPVRLDKVPGNYIHTGLPMTEVRDFAERMGWSARLVRRTDPGASIPTPAVLHAKEGHYAALLAGDPEAGEYFLEDRGLGFAGWVGRETVDRMSSGHFLVDSATATPGFVALDDREGGRLFGRDGAHGLAPTDESSDEPPDTGCDGGGAAGSVGMVRYTLLPHLAAVRLMDSPVGYAPPVGPPVRLALTYNELDESPVAPSHANAGRQWSVNWVSWIEPPTGRWIDGSQVRVRRNRGGTRVMRYDTGRAEFGPHDRHFTVLRRAGTNAFELTHPDGSTEVYARPDHPTRPTRWFMTAFRDPQGNAITLAYDDRLRLTTVTDAVGQTTRLDYELSADALKITRVTDPFGRSATLAYNGAGQLTAITDTLGLVSRMEYGISGDVVQKLVTPYGTTTFTRTLGKQTWDRTVEVTDPLGGRERLTYSDLDQGVGVASANVPPRNFFVAGEPVTFYAEHARLQFRNSYYWSKVAMAMAPGDPAAARNYRWYTDTDWKVQPILEAVKEPLEDRVWFNYPGASGAQRTAGTAGGESGLPNYPGQGAKPEKILRMLGDGTPQLVRLAYNRLGNPTRVVDPLGRSTEIRYATNDIDVVEILQTTGGLRERLASFAWDDRHSPIRVTDTAGMATVLRYNARGQVLTVTNPRGEVTTYAYDDAGYLVAVDAALPGTGDTSTFAYDAFGRPNRVTAADGYVLRYEYDVFDRVARIAYPNQTTEEYTYDRLDLVAHRDRLGRTTSMTHDALGRLVRLTDPAGRTVAYEWCGCGSPEALVDPMGRTTRWVHDVQGRVVAKQYVDGSQVRYVYEPESSRLQRRIDEKNQTTVYEYNVDDTLARVSYPDAAVATPGVSYEYDENYPRLVSMMDSLGTSRFTYHPVSEGILHGAGKLAVVDGPWAGDEIKYGYDEIGQVKERVLGTSRQAFEYDALGRPVKVTNRLGQFEYSYSEKHHRPTRVTAQDGLETALSFTNLSGIWRLASIVHSRPRTGERISEHKYEHDAVGRIRRWSVETSDRGPSTWEMGYDEADQLTSLIVAFGGQVRDERRWTYDAAGNMTTAQGWGFTNVFGYNALNQTTYASPDLERVRYEWNVENRLVAVIRGTTRTEFVYDGFGRLGKLSERVDDKEAGASSFVWSEWEMQERRNGDGSTVDQRYYPQGFEGLSGEWIGRLRYTRDHLGSVREVVGEAGQVVQRLEYDAWGSPSKAFEAPSPPLGYTGHFWHGASRLTLAPYRAYDPLLARWLSRDPSGERTGHNLFIYVGNNPISFTDPYGLERFVIIVGDPGLADHNVGRNFDRAAQTLADRLIANGDTVDVVRASSVDDFNRAITSGPLIDGGVYYFGHGWDGVLYVGEGPDPSTNIDPASNLGTLSGANLGPGATIQLNACRSGAGGVNSIAQSFANQLGRPTSGSSSPMSFSPNGVYSNRPFPPSTGPIQMVPGPGGSLVTFTPNPSPSPVGTPTSGP